MQVYRAMKLLGPKAALVFLGACAVGGEGPLRTGDPCTQGFVDEVVLARQLAAAQPCCDDYARMPFVRVLKSENLSIAGSSPVFQFPTGKSRFVAVDLQGFDESQAVLTPLSSTALTAPADFTCSSDKTQARSRTVKPVVLWLGADKRPLGAADRGSPAVTRGAAGWAFPRPAAARYMVIYSVPTEYGSAVDLPAPRAGLLLETETVGLAAALHPQRTLGPAKFTASPTGYFESLIP